MSYHTPDIPTQLTEIPVFRATHAENQEQHGEWWTNERGQLHADDRPAVIISCNGNPIERRWYQNGKLKRVDDQPTIVKNHLSHPEVVYENRWMTSNNVLHREGDLPAFERFNIKGESITTLYYKNGKMHRTEGPAAIFMYGHPEYWVNGCKIPKSIWEEEYGPKRVPITIEAIEKVLGYKITIVDE